MLWLIPRRHHWIPCSLRRRPGGPRTDWTGDAYAESVRASWRRPTLRPDAVSLVGRPPEGGPFRPALSTAP